MYHCIKKFLVGFLLVLFAFCVANAHSHPKLTIPFSDTDWQDMKADVKTQYGEPLLVYPSAYGGDCLTYEHEFLQQKGIVKYMFNENGTLMSIAWSYTASDRDTLNAVYEQIIAFAIEAYGDGEDTPTGINNTGQRWETDLGAAIITVIYTAEVHALQFSFIRPQK